MKAFSVDLVGELALFKKNDANDMTHISYNFIHKPMLLGLFGAIMGIPGYANTVDISTDIKLVNEKINKLMNEISNKDKLTKGIFTKVENLLELLSRLKKNISLQKYRDKIALIIAKLSEKKSNLTMLKTMKLSNLEIHIARSFPDYYLKLKDIKLAIQPMYKKPLKKIINGFNDSSGFSNKGIKGGATWQISEQIMLGEPEIRYRVFILDYENIDILKQLKGKLKKHETEYPLYFGKNEFFAHYENFREYNLEALEKDKKYKFDSLVLESKITAKQISFDDFDPFDFNSNSGLSIYENLPFDFDEMGFYKKDLFLLSQKEFSLKDNNQFYRVIDTKTGENFNVQFI